MTKSSIIKQEILTLLSDNQQHSVQEMKEFLKTRQIGEYTEGQFAGAVNNMQKNNLIRNVERGVYILGKDISEQKRCSVVSPIGDEGTDIRKNADQLLNHIIRPVCQKCGFEAIRIDQAYAKPDSITQAILDSLYKADLVIADLTGHNPNVFFEIGYRTAMGKPIIHLKKKNENIPFDISAIRTFDYDLTDLDAVAETRSRLEKVISSFVYEDDLDDDENIDGNENNKVITLLNDISYKLDTLGEDVRKKDQENIKAIIEACKGLQPVNESLESQMMKILLPELLRNPNAADSLIQLGQKLKK